MLYLAVAPASAPAATAIISFMADMPLLSRNTTIKFASLSSRLETISVLSWQPKRRRKMKMLKNLKNRGFILFSKCFLSNMAMDSLTPSRFFLI